MEARQAVLVGFLLFVVVYEALGQVDLHDVPVINQPPKKVIRYKLIRISDEDIKKEQDAKRVQQLNDAKHAYWHKKLFPCEDYSPICGRYKNIWNPGVAQCRDVFMQTNCRETCGLCNIPFGVFLGCNDMHHCKALGSNACVHKWVEETCKTMCGSCDGSKGRGTARVGASSVFVGKKKSIVHKEIGEKKEQKEAVENQSAAIETEVNPHAQETVEDNSHAQETVEDVEDHEDDENEDDMENQSGSNVPYNMENMESASGEPADQSGESAETETPDPKSKVEKPKVEAKEEVKAPVVQDAPKKVVEAKKPVHHKTHKVHHHHHHHKHHHHHHKNAHHHTKKVQHDKKPKKVVNPVKVLVNKHKKTTKS